MDWRRWAWVVLQADPQLWACVQGQPTTDPGAHLPAISGVGTHLGFQFWAPWPLMDVRAHPGTLCLCTQAAGPLIRVRTHPGFQLWAPSPLILVLASQASDESWGCLSCVHSPGAEGGGAPEAPASAESSLTSC